MRRIISLLCILAVALAAMSSCFAALKTAVNPIDKNEHLYLVVGFDDAAENTDVIFTAGFDKTENTASFVQIPRDTYCNFGAAQNKINQIYAVRRAAGDSANEAMAYLAEKLSSLFGVAFDGYIGITTEAFKNIVDSLGGVEIELSRDMVFTMPDGETLSLHAGKNLISADEAENFVRYRQGYAMGDLSRIDAQKLFLNAVFEKAASGMNISMLMSVLSAVNNGVITNVNLRAVTALALSSLRSSGRPSTLFVTLPGEPIIAENNLSYYVLNRKSAAEVVKRHMFSSGKFDADGKFNNENELSFNNIYNDDNAYYKEYSGEDLNNIVIK